MQYLYAAKSESGARVEGTIEAASLAEAKTAIRARGLFPLSVDDFTAAPSVSRKVRSSRGKKVPRKELLTITSQLAIMTRSGVDLADALHNVAEQCRHMVLRQVLQDVHADVSAGQPVSFALRQHEAAFGSTYVASVAAGEASGTLTQVLSRLASLIRNEIRMRSALASVLAYPLVLMGVAVAVLLMMVLFVLPQFSQVFRDLGATAPPMTQVLLDGSEWIRGHLVWVAGSVAAVGIGIGQLFTSRAGQLWRDRLLMSAPVVAPACQALLTGRLLRLLGSMLQTGVPLLEGLRLCRNAASNRFFQDLFHKLEEEVINGRGISSTLAAAEFVPAGAAQMVGTAEQSGHLGEVMLSVGEFYEDQGEAQVRQAVKLLEPAVIVVMGVLVAGLVMAVMLPLLDVSTLSG